MRCRFRVQVQNIHHSEPKRRTLPVRQFHRLRANGTQRDRGGTKGIKCEMRPAHPVKNVRITRDATASAGRNHSRRSTASAGRNVRWARMYSIGTGNREFWMHLWRMFSKKEFEGKGWLMRQKEELIWDRRGAKREHGTRSTARLLIFPFNHPASLARVRSALPSASLVPTDSSAGETSHTPRPTLAQVARGKRPEPPWQHGGPRSASGPTRSDPRRPIRTLIAGAGNTNDGTTRLISTVSPE